MPRLPENKNKNFIKNPVLEITTSMTRDEILNYIFEKSEYDQIAQLSLYTFRQMNKISWTPFFKTAFERNPVSLKEFKNLSIDNIYKILYELPNRSIYDNERLAQPDEVCNFKIGDGIEKAILFANILKNNYNQLNINLNIENKVVSLQNDEKKFYFDTTKNLKLNELLTHI